MSMVTLVSGGLDSTTMALLAAEKGISQHPLFIDYGQRGRTRELAACQANFSRFHLPKPHIASLAGYGALVPSGLTDPSRHIVNDVFLPGRNLLFLTVGAAYAVSLGVASVAIGLLHEAYSLFPDQTSQFITEAQLLISRAMNRDIAILTPLMTFSKGDVVTIAKMKGITNTYSCHAGSEVPCGICVACQEYIGLEV